MSAAAEVASSVGGNGENISFDQGAVSEDVLNELRKLGIDEYPLYFCGRPLLMQTSRKDTTSPHTEFMFAEHSYLGNETKLRQANGETINGYDLKIELPNKLVLTYGQINALAGDFYGTKKPISDGNGPDDQRDRFIAAFNTLATDQKRQPAECNAILKALDKEIKDINDLLKDGHDTSKAYSQIRFPLVELEAITIKRFPYQPSFLGLAKINWDHWGEDARTAYNAGHDAALCEAAKGNLLIAYAMNAFADHFLEDSLSAGHCRTPRRHLTSDDPTDKGGQCAVYAHDEDNAIGLEVRLPGSDEKYRMYGDKRLGDGVDKEHQAVCLKAIQTSADEIYDAYKSRQIPPVSSYGVWKIVPTLESARSKQRLPPLFKVENGVLLRRADVNDRQTDSYTKDFTFPKTVDEIKSGRRWEYPITWP